MQLTSARALPLGTVIAGEWRVERMLGEGGFAVTYEAHSPKTGQQVALKEYMPAGCCNRAPGSSQITASAGKEGEVFHWGRERFMKEAETLARLDHPSIVRVAGYFEANGTAYMALAYEAGGTLKSWLTRLGRAPTQAELDAILWPLLDALKEVHSLFLLHRDIKPDNILMRGDGTPVLIDFGATRSAIAGHTQAVGGVNPAATSAFAIVSHGYSPPEQYDPAGRMVGPVSDVYALAATLYTSLTGGPPPAATSRHFNDPYQPLAGTPTLVGYRAEFLAGIDRALAINPKDRPQSAVEFRRAIGLQSAPQGTSLAWRQTEVASAPGGNREALPSVPPVTFTTIESGAKRPDEKPRSRPLLVVVGLLAFSVIGAGGWWLVKTRADLSIVKAEVDRREAEVAARQRAEAEAKRRTEEEAAARRRAEEAERQRLAALKAEEDRKRADADAKRRAEEEARRRDPVAALVPGSGRFARDRLADGSDCAYCPEMVVVPPGRFIMGSPASEPERGEDEEQVLVAIPRSFAVARFAVTFHEWHACVSDGGCNRYKPNDQGWGQENRPVINVSWDDAKAYVSWLSLKTGKSYRLLSESEREYVTRAGTTTPFWWGASITSSQANYDASAEPYQRSNSRGEYRQRTVPVDSFQPNPWGLYQVHGNVWEWAEDCWNDSNSGNPGDGSARLNGNCDRRVIRGGSWFFNPHILRSAFRSGSAKDDRDNSIGFRVGRTL